MGKIQHIQYFTPDRVAKISQDNQAKYDKYLKSCVIRNKDTEETTYYVYKNYFKQFLVYLAENWDNVDLYSAEFEDNAIDIMEGFMDFCQSTLKNHKKAINTKLSAISAFYIWSVKRGLIKYHPFQGKLDRLKNSNDEHIISTHYLTEDQIQTIRRALSENDKFDIQDQLLFEIAYDSANRIGALQKLTISSLDLDEMLFKDIREKEGYIVDVVFDDVAKELLEEWISMRTDNLDHLEVDAVFISKYKGVYKQAGKLALYDRVKKIGQIVGIPDFRPHCIRKSRLNNIYEETGDLVLAAELGNHKSTETTRRFYTKKKSKSEIRDKINALKKKNSENK